MRKINSFPFVSFRLKSSLVLIIPFFFMLFSCKGEQHEKEVSALDSLNNHCYALLMRLQTDSLRQVAEVYMKSAPLHSKTYFKARQYYINAYFNAKDYDKVLELLSATEQMEHFNEYPEVACDYLYTRARVFQYTQRYLEAIQVFKECLTFKTSKAEQEKLLPTVLTAMTQLMNTYIRSGQVEEGYRYYLQLKRHPAPLIRQFAFRDLYVHLSYLATLSGHTLEAYRLADSVFVLPLHDPTPEKLFRDYSYASVVYYENPDTKEKVMKWLEQAIDEADKYDYVAGLDWCMDMLGTLYLQQNRIEESLELEHKALAMAKKRRDKSAQCNIYSTLSTLYKGWELYDHAIEYANQAIRVIMPTDDNLLKGMAFSAKASIFKSMERFDSAVYYYKGSEYYYAKARIPREYHRAKGNIADVMINSGSADSLALGVHLVRGILEKLTLDEERSYYFYNIGKGLIKQGKIVEGETMLDSMYVNASRIQNVVYAEGVLEFVIDHYLSRGNAAKVMQYTSFYRRQVGIRYDEKISQKVASAMIQYQTEKKEQQLKLATAELNIKNLRIKLYVGAILLLLLVFTGGILWYLRERKLQKRRNLLVEQEKKITQREFELAEKRLRTQELELNSVLENLRDVNMQSEQMREQFDEFLAHRDNQQGIASITPSVFREKGEVKFRRYFTQLYPNFLHALKDAIPDITRGEEVLCMLVYLGQNTDEVADILCIEKKSVKMSRYRLRKKIGKDKEESLDDFIRRLL